MTDAAVAVDLDHSLDIHTDFTTEVTLDVVVVFDFLTELGYFLLGQILGAGIGIDTGYLEDLLGGGSANAVNIGQSDLYALCVRNINACNTSHIDFPLSLSLSLFMLGVLTDYHDTTLALDNFALFANFLDGWLNLHFVTIPFLFGTPSDAALGQVIDRDLDGYLITGQNPYIVHSELARNMGIYDVSVGKLYLEMCIGQRFQYHSLELYNIILRQKNPSSLIYDTVLKIRRFRQPSAEASVGHNRGIASPLRQDRSDMLYLFAFRLFKTPSLAVGKEQIPVLFPDNQIQAVFVMSAKRRHDPSDVGAHSVESTLVK